MNIHEKIEAGEAVDESVKENMMKPPLKRSSKGGAVRPHHLKVSRKKNNQVSCNKYIANVLLMYYRLISLKLSVMLTGSASVIAAQKTRSRVSFQKT